MFSDTKATSLQGTPAIDNAIRLFRTAHRLLTQFLQPAQDPTRVHTNHAEVERLYLAQAGVLYDIATSQRLSDRDGNRHDASTRTYLEFIELLTTHKLDHRKLSCAYYGMALNAFMSMKAQGRDRLACFDKVRLLYHRGFDAHQQLHAALRPFCDRALQEQVELVLRHLNKDFVPRVALTTDPDQQLLGRTNEMRRLLIRYMYITLNQNGSHWAREACTPSPYVVPTQPSASRVTSFEEHVYSRRQTLQRLGDPGLPCGMPPCACQFACASHPRAGCAWRLSAGVHPQLTRPQCLPEAPRWAAHLVGRPILPTDCACWLRVAC